MFSALLNDWASRGWSIVLVQQDLSFRFQDFFGDIYEYVTRPHVYQKAVIGLIFLFLGLVWGLLSSFRAHRLKYDPKKDPRRSPHYFRGMHALMSKDWATASRELTKVVEISSEPVEVYLLLGNMYRDQGQLEKAIRIHQSILVRQDLTKEEKILALNAVGADFFEGGMLDRAVETYQQALELRPNDPNAVRQLEKLHEELRQWDKAYALEKKIQGRGLSRDRKTLAHLLIEKAKQRQEEGSILKAGFHYWRALRLSDQAPSAALHLGDLYREKGKVKKCIKAWKTFCRLAPDKAHILLDQLEEVMTEQGENFQSYLDEFLQNQPTRHGFHYAIQRALKAKDRDRALAYAKQGMGRFPRSGLLLKSYWQLSPAAQGEEDFTEGQGKHRGLADHYLCSDCRYQTLDVLWRCPNCKEWNSFGEEWL